MRSVGSGQLLALRCPRNGLPYLLGFSRKAHAELLLAKTPSLKLTRGRPTNVAGDVNESVRRMCEASNNKRHVPSLTDLVIDVDALVEVVDSLTTTPPLTADTMPYIDFIMLPIERNIGVVLANELVERELLTFASHVIDPAYAVNMFRRCQ
jgi:hypothetical protein